MAATKAAAVTGPTFDTLCKRRTRSSAAVNGGDPLVRVRERRPPGAHHGARTWRWASASRCAGGRPPTERLRPGPGHCGDRSAPYACGWRTWGRSSGRPRRRRGRPPPNTGRLTRSPSRPRGGCARARAPSISAKRRGSVRIRRSSSSTPSTRMHIWLSFLCRSMPIWSMAGALLLAPPRA